MIDCAEVEKTSKHCRGDIGHMLLQLVDLKTLVVLQVHLDSSYPQNSTYCTEDNGEVVYNDKNNLQQ